MLFKQLDKETCVIASAYKASIELKLTPLKIEFNIILLINHRKQCLQYLAFTLHYKLLTFK